LQLAIMLGNVRSREAALRGALNPDIDVAHRVQLLQLLSDVADTSLVEPLLKLVTAAEAEPVRIEAVRTLAHVDDPKLAAMLIALHGTSTSESLKSEMREVLLARKDSAFAWLMAVERGDIAASVTPLDQVRRVALLEDPKLDSLVARHWGKLDSATREEKLAEVRRLNNDLRAAAGNAQTGKAVFMKRCAACHQLFGEGTKLGPDLTAANRADRDFLLVSLVDPSSVIRKEFVNVVVQTIDGRVLTGLPVAQDAAGVTLLSPKNEKTAVAASEIEDVHESPVSMMPDDLYRQLSPQELRDLFAYLQSPTP
jgi:putative heme-binding domain-containing protein